MPNENRLRKLSRCIFFFEENYSLPAIADNLDTLSPKELRCACCLMGVALVALSQKKTIWERLKTMGLGSKE
ncbi:MAG: hypothetical protein ACLUE2_23145 [Bacteroides cellulosilyticus]